MSSDPYLDLLAQEGLNAAGASDLGQQLKGAVARGVSSAAEVAATAAAIAYLLPTAAAGALASMASAMGLGALVGSSVPVLGTAIGAVVGIVVGLIQFFGGKSSGPPPPPNRWYGELPNLLGLSGSDGMKIAKQAAQQLVAQTVATLKDPKTWARPGKPTPPWQLMWPVYYEHLRENEVGNERWRSVGMQPCFRDAIEEVVGADFTAWLVRQSGWVDALRHMGSGLRDDVAKRVPGALADGVLELARASLIGALPFPTVGQYIDAQATATAAANKAGPAVAALVAQAMPPIMVRGLLGLGLTLQATLAQQQGYSVMSNTPPHARRSPSPRSCPRRNQGASEHLQPRRARLRRPQGQRHIYGGARRIGLVHGVPREPRRRSHRWACRRMERRGRAPNHGPCRA